MTEPRQPLAPETPAHQGPIFLERPWLWLLFSIYYFIPFFYVEPAWSFHGVLLLAYGIFVGLFLLAIRFIKAPGSWQFRGVLAGMLVLGMLIMPLSPGSSTCFAYAAFLLGYILPLRRVLLALLLMAAVTVLISCNLANPQLYLLAPSIIGILATGGWGYLEQMRFRLQAQVLKSQEETRTLAAIAERERIARDLHDLLGHTLSSIAITAELAEKLLERQRPEEALERIRALHQVAREGLGLVRQTVSGYKHRGLGGEVLRLCDTLRARGFTVHIEGSIPELDARAETIAILTLTELTTNVLRHSNGSHCVLSFARHEDHTEIHFSDNGKIRQLQPGNGLRGIQERLHSIGARLTIDTRQATCFRMLLPVFAPALHQE